MSLALQRRSQGYFPCRAVANERLEVRSGKPGAADWEWGLGSNTQVASQLVNINNIDWTSGKPIRFTLNYTSTGTGTLNLYDSLTNNLLASKSYTNTASPLRVGNALKLYIKQSAGSGAGVKVRAQISKINGNTLTTPLDLETTGDNLFNDKSAYAETPTAAGQTGMMVDGQVTVTWGSNPFPNGSRLGVTINAGSAPCVGAASTSTTTGTTTPTTTPVGTPGVTALYFAHPDHLGTPRAITTSDATNTKVWEWSNSDGFGANLPNEDPANTGTAFKYNLRFPGQYFDQETNTNYNYFRDYDPGTGRYIESDPMGLKGSINTYSYVKSSPLRLIDFFGLKAQICCKKIPGLPAAHCFVNEVADEEKKCENCTSQTRRVGLQGPAPWGSSEYKNVGQVRIDDGFDQPGESRCGEWNESCEVSKCIDKVIAKYPAMSIYRAVRGPNSNTFASLVASECGLKQGDGPWPTPGWGKPAAGPAE